MHLIKRISKDSSKKGPSIMLALWMYGGKREIGEELSGRKQSLGGVAAHS